MNKPRSKELIIIGAGGHGKIIADCAKLLAYESISFIDDRFGDEDFSVLEARGWQVIGRMDWLFLADYKHCDIAIGIGNNELRHQLYLEGSEQGFYFPTLIHPSSVVSEYAHVGEATLVLAGAVINIDSHVGNACIINTSSSVDHDCIVNDACHIAVQAALAGGVTLGERSFIGMNASLIPGVSISEDTLLAAGAVLTHSTNKPCLLAGVPAIVKSTFAKTAAV